MSDLEEKDTKRNVPKLRFPGFTDPWEQRKLGEVATFGKGFGFSKSDFAEDGEQLFHYGRLYTDYECVIRSVDTHAAPKDGAVFSTGGEVVTPSSGETAEDIAIASAIVSPGIMLGGGLNIVRPCSQLDPVFLALSISSGQQHYDLARRAQGKSVVHLYNDDLAKSFLVMPRQIKEQREIGRFFETFDDLITLRQRELDHVKLMKRGLLQKMFPKDGADTPEIRFPGFADPWEQRKFSDLTDRVSIQSSDPDLPQVEYEDIISGEGTLNKDLRDKEGGKTGIKFYAGDVLYGKLRPYLMNWLYPQFNGVAVGDFWVLRATECDSSFLYRLIQTDSFQRLANVSSGSKMPRADWNLISQSFFAVPVDHAEQKVIAKSLAELDSLITLRQRELDHVKLLKKSLLQQMFV